MKTALAEEPIASFNLSGPLVVLLGPTATGKSAIAVEVAEETGGVEILSVDSMNVYKEMDIGTAKPTAQARQRIHHHLIDLADPSEEYSVARFQAEALAALEDVRRRGKLPLLVGGTGLYLRSVIDDLRLPGQYPLVRAELEERARQVGLAALYAHLEQLDPLAAQKILPNNERRLLRALEVTLGSGKPFSSFGPGLEAYPENGVVQFGLELEMSDLDLRIIERIDEQMEMGWLEETRHLLSRQGGLSKTARQALGYRELAAHLLDDVPLEEAVNATKRRTRAFARRQRSWFRRDPRISWKIPNDARQALKEVLNKSANAL